MIVTIMIVIHHDREMCDVTPYCALNVPTPCRLIKHNSGSRTDLMRHPSVLGLHLRGRRVYGKQAAHRCRR